MNWINDPFANAAAESKFLQLRIGAESGFAIPETIVTNSRADAADFMAACGGEVVIKALHAPLIQAEDAPLFVYSELFNRDLLHTMEDVESVPFILQRAIRPKKDVRVTVVDEVASERTGVCRLPADLGPTYPDNAPHPTVDSVSENTLSYAHVLALLEGSVLNQD